MGLHGIKKILLVEDCPSDAFLLEHMLAGVCVTDRIDITHVSRLIDAFQRIEEEFFDLILLDLNLLDMDGVASVAALSTEAPSIPIIVYSGTENRKIREAALMCGAAGYLIKGRENGLSLRLAIDHAIQSGRNAAPALQRYN